MILFLSKIIFCDLFIAIPLIFASIQFLTVSNPIVGRSTLRSWFAFGNFTKIDLSFNLYLFDKFSDLLMASSVPSGPSIART
jgi:hypothetical protein